MPEREVFNMDCMVNKVYNEDCIIGMSNIPDNSVDMILCDLPYGTTQCKWDVIIPFDKLWEHYERLIKDNGAIVLTGSEPFSSQLRLSNLKLYKYDWIWDKIKGTGFLNAKKQPMRNHEIISVFYKNQCIYNPQKTFGHIRKTIFRSSKLQTEVYGEIGKIGKGYRYDSTDRYPRSILQFSTDTQKSSIHPTQKPVALFEYLINTYTNTGAVVLDNCMGSGTTAIACLRTNRKFIWYELDKFHFNNLTKRIDQWLIANGNPLFKY